VTISLDAPANSFMPSALGAGIDGHHAGEEKRMLSPANVKEMLTAGLKPISYRLRTELAVDAWHWNPRGSWSDAARKQGYWISDAHSAEPIQLCYGYHLPRRGDTLDEANNDGYSRLDDGDPKTFWKSNPYLDEYFTGEENSRHPQWVVIDLGTDREINALRIRWGTPFATRFTVDYASGDEPFFWEAPPGAWTDFPKGKIDGAKGGEGLLSLADKSVSARFIRIRMTAASGIAPEGSTDVRDRLGYAIREIEAGLVDPDGTFHDWLVHAKSKRQTQITVSSTDPWHREIDRDDQVEQPGFDMLVESGLTNSLPMLVPVAVVYDTPENAAAEIAFLKSRGYDVPRVEMGEEPDGQKMNPADYGALYIQWADAIHKAAPSAQLGGPCFVTIDFDKQEPGWRFGNGWWIRHFLDYLQARNRSGDFNFFSFEWYPFDDFCKPSAPQLLEAPGLLRNALELVRQNGISARIPMIISEYGYSAYDCQDEVDLQGGLLNADIAGLFLTLGGETAYLYGYEPNRLEVDPDPPEEDAWCHSWGTQMLFLQNARGGIRSPVATYYAARMVTRDWVQPSGGVHEIFPAKADIGNPGGEDLVTAYALRRPDKRWSVLLINKDPATSYEIRLRFDKAGKETATQPAGPYDVYQFSSKEYVWHANGPRGFPSRSQPPSHQVIQPADAARGFLLPPYSLTVVRSSK